MNIERVRRSQHDQVCALISEQIVEETLLDRGWGLVQSPLEGTRRLLTLVTDGSVVGSCTAHDAGSQAILAHLPGRGEHTLEIDLAGGAAHIQGMLIEVHAWLDAIWAFYATGAVSAPLDWTEAPSAANHDRERFSEWVREHLIAM